MNVSRYNAKEMFGILEQLGQRMSYYFQRFFSSSVYGAEIFYLTFQNETFTILNGKLARISSKQSCKITLITVVMF